MDRVTRLRWWWQSLWGATLAGLGWRRSRRWSTGIALRWGRPGPPPDLSKVPRPVWLPPEDEIGVATDIRAVLATGERFAIALADCIAYSTGFDFTISYRSRDDISRELLAIGVAPHNHRELEVRIEYPDGGNADSHDHGEEAMNAHYEASYEGRDPPLPAGPVVLPQRGGGGGKRFEYSYWCWPLPPEGPMTISVEWPAAGLAPTNVVIDASAIHRAGLMSRKLWSD